jgi:hypothetical protein
MYAVMISLLSSLRGKPNKDYTDPHKTPDLDFLSA